MVNGQTEAKGPLEPVKGPLDTVGGGEAPGRRLAVVEVPRALLAAALRLPEGSDVRNVHYDYKRDSYMVVVRSPGLPELPPGQEVPKRAPRLVTKTTTHTEVVCEGWE